MTEVDVIIIGAGASGLMCAIEAGKRQRRVLLLEHANKAGKKILMSGGGRCNFTNYHVSADNYLSANRHFCKSALSRYTQWDFIAMVEHYGIAYHERDHGQLFCNHSAKDILQMLLTECRQQRVTIQLQQQVQQIQQNENGSFAISTEDGCFSSRSLVIATGGLSIPKMGATPFGYRLAQQFGLSVTATCAGLVPFTLHNEDKQRFSPLSGIAVDCIVNCNAQSFRENLLFTHRGLSGPAMLQISSYWNPGDTLHINLLPDFELEQQLAQFLLQSPNKQLKSVLTSLLPKRLIEQMLPDSILQCPLKQLSAKQKNLLIDSLHDWQIKPNATEGYRTAEVTMGGVSCDEISSKTMQSHKVPGLYFIGEVLDVTGWLGGYNFQWAWSSGWCAGQVV